MATRKEQTFKRFGELSGWIRNNLPDSSTGFMVSDIDFVLFNYNLKKIMIIEVKTYMSTVRTWQKNFYRNLDKWLRRGICEDWQYYGCNLLQFEKTHFNDGKCFFNKKEITEKELITILSFGEF